MGSPPSKTQSQYPSPIVSSEDLGWRSITVAEFQQPPGNTKLPPELKHTLALCLAAKPYRIWQAVGDRSYSGIYSKGVISLAPAQLPCAYKVYGDDHYLEIKIATSALERVAEEAMNWDLTRLDLRTEFHDRNPRIEQLAMMLRAELHRGEEGMGELYIESLTNALTVNLLRDYSGTKPEILTYEGGLNDRALVKVSEYIHERLGEKIKLEDLASHIGITQFHFSRLFKKSTGMSPHQYVMQQRIERAKQLLKTADISITDVALDCGFSSQSHLGKYFRQLTGMTPKTYRRS